MVLLTILSTLIGTVGGVLITWFLLNGFPRIVAFLDIEGPHIVCRVQHKGALICRDVRFSFTKTTPTEWEGWPEHILYLSKEETRLPFFATGMDRTYIVTTAFEGSDTGRGFLPSITCEIKWKVFGFISKQGQYILDTRHLLDIPYSVPRNLDEFVSRNWALLERVLNRTATILRFKEEEWPRDAVFATSLEAVESWSKVEDKDHPNHDDFYHKPGAPHEGKCPHNKKEEN